MAKKLHASLQGVFEPREDENIDLDSLSNEQKIARAEQVRALIRHEGWKVLNEMVYLLTGSLKDSISTAKLENVKYIQGQINGLEAYQNAASVVLDHGDLAQEALEEETEKQQEAKNEGRPA